MTDKKWTPGPWVVDPHCLAEIVTTGGLKVSSVWSQEDVNTIIVIEKDCVSDDDYKANAQLIAAAPDLYDALEDVVIALSVGWELDDFITNATSALMKARGEQ